VSTRSPARLIVALAVAAVLAVFLLYTAVAGKSTPTLTPSEVATRSGELSVVGVVVAPVRGDSHASGGLRFALRNIDGKSGLVRVVYRGESPPPLFKVGRNVVVSGTYGAGRLDASGIVTKCPSKYTTTQPAA
jgi:cytochrome c-type biogenesis protein CcmE